MMKREAVMRDDITEEGEADISLSSEERAEIVANLSEQKTKEFINRQEEIVSASVADVMSKYPKSREKGNAALKNKRKVYACTQYGKDFGLSGCAANYCVAIQFDAMNEANREIGRQLKQDLYGQLPETDSLVQNPLFLKDINNFRNVQQPVCARDSTWIQETRTCPETIKKYNSGGFVDNPSAGSTLKVENLVSSNGQVLKDKNGEPKLKDGDLLFVRVGKADNTSSGLHCIRANVSEDGKVTYTAGNGDHVKENMYRDWHGKSVAVFHTSEYAEKCFKHQFECLNDKDLMQLNEAMKQKQQMQEPVQKFATEQVEGLEEVQSPDGADDMTMAQPAVQQNALRPDSANDVALNDFSKNMVRQHSSMSDRIASFRQRRDTESVDRANMVASMRADNEQLQQRRAALAKMRGEMAQTSRTEYMFETKHYACEDIAGRVAERQASEEKQEQNVQQQPQQVSGLRRFFNVFSSRTA